MSDKAQTNRKWTSSDKYRSNWDATFNKTPNEEQRQFSNSVIADAQEKALQDLVDLTQELGLYEKHQAEGLFKQKDGPSLFKHDPWHAPDPERTRYINSLSADELRELYEQLPK